MTKLKVITKSKFNETVFWLTQVPEVPEEEENTDEMTKHNKMKTMNVHDHSMCKLLKLSNS